MDETARPEKTFAIPKQLVVSERQTLERLMREHLESHRRERAHETEPGSVMSVNLNPFQAAKALERYGPWGVVILLCIIMFFLYRSMDKRIDKMATVFARSNKQFITLIEKITKVKK